MTTFLITGGAGFIGSNFIRYLLNQYGNVVRVHTVDALTYAGNLENLRDLSNSSHLFHKADITDAEEMGSLFKKESIDVVVHFAAESHVDRSIQASRKFFETNVIGTQILLESIRQYPVKKFIHISTDEVYGSLGESGTFSEDSPLKPNSPYAASKASADLVVRSYFKTYGVPAVITRCSNNYGPYQFPEKMIPLMISNMLEDRPLPVYGNGMNIRDWIYVEDHCRAIDCVIQKGKIGEIYNIGGNSETRNIDLVKQLLKLAGKTESLIQFVPDRPGHDYRYAIDYSKIKRDLDWEPKVTPEEGLNHTFRWYLNHQKWWKRIQSGEYRQYYEKQYKMSLG